MQQDIERTTIEGPNGVQIEYATLPFGFKAGSKLIAKLGVILGKTLGAAGAQERDGDDLGQLFGAAGAGLAALAEAILTKGGPDFVAELLANTTRFDAGDGGKARKLRNMEELDRVYARNYIECGRAIGWVVQVNFVPFSMDGIDSLDSLLEKLEQLVPESLRPKKKTESESEPESGASSEDA